MMEILSKPWPWYVVGPLIGLMVPMLLIIGNKAFGISSSFRHICAACFPLNIAFFKYEWKKEIWLLYFVLGLTIGGYLATNCLNSHEVMNLNPKLVTDLNQYGLTDFKTLVPSELFNWENLFTMKGLIFIIIGGFLVGFGTRYAGGCTSGHAIMGLSTLQLPSLIATICFMAGGFLVANFLVPLFLSL